MGPRFFFHFSTYMAHPNSLTFFFTLPLSSFSLSHTHFVLFVLSFLTSISCLSSPPPLFFTFRFLLSLLVISVVERIFCLCVRIFFFLSLHCVHVFVLVCERYAITRWVSKISRASQEAFSKHTKKNKIFN